MISHWLRSGSNFQQPALRVVLVGLLGCCTACADNLQAQESAPTSPSPAAAATTVVALGKLVPEGDVIKISVANAQDSRVNQILVKEGDQVKANQVIAILQGRDRVEQQLRNAEANVTIKRAQLQKIREGEAKAAEIVAQQAVITELEARLTTETTQRQAAIAEAQATLQNMALKYQRYQMLSQEGAVQRAELDDAREAFEKAQATVTRTQAELNNTVSTLQAQLEKERANLSRLREVRPVDVEIAQAELQQAEIQVEQQRAELNDTLVRVPVAGQILRINTRVGEQVNTQEGIAELGRTEQMYAIAEVYETDIVRVRQGQSVVITSEYGGFQGELQGRVDHIGLQIGKANLEQNESDPKTDINARVVEVKVRLNSSDSQKVAALTGMQMRVKIDTAAKP
jgi:HlyD family secretion protein